jgi:four helix bundle protein
MAGVVVETEKDQPLDIEDRTYRFAIRIVRLCRHLGETPGVNRTLGQQLLRSGTSVGANVEEARAAYSRAEFCSKMIIDLKEARETRFWLRLLMDAECIDRTLLEPLLSESTEIMKVIGAIASKARREPD